MPEVIANTSPLQYLHQLGWLHLLAEFLLRAKREGRIAVLKPLLATLETLGFHLDEPTRATILRLAEEDQ